MGEVPITINGKLFKMSCGDGQEEHTQVLARYVDSHVAELREETGSDNERYLFLMACLQIADELSDSLERLGRLEDDMAAMRADMESSRGQSAAKVSETEERVAGALNSAAGRIEALLHRLAPDAHETAAPSAPAGDGSDSA